MQVTFTDWKALKVKGRSSRENTVKNQNQPDPVAEACTSFQLLNKLSQKNQKGSCLAWTIYSEFKTSQGNLVCLYLKLKVKIEMGRRSFGGSSGAACSSSMPKALGLISSTKRSIKIIQDFKGQSRKYCTHNFPFAKAVIPLSLLPCISGGKAQIRTRLSGSCSWRRQVGKGQQMVSDTCQESQEYTVCQRLFGACHICKPVPSLPHTSQKRRPGSRACLGPHS